MLGRAGLAPAQLRHLLDPGERVLGVADAGPATVLATPLGVWVPTATEQGWRRIGWDRIVKATWTQAGLHIVEGTTDEDGMVTDLPVVAYSLAEARNLPAVLRQRVENSIARWEQIRVPGGTARLVARRIPGQDGLTWTGRLDSGTPDSPDARDRVVAQLQQLRAVRPTD